MYSCQSSSRQGCSVDSSVKHGVNETGSGGSILSRMIASTVEYRSRINKVPEEGKASRRIEAYRHELHASIFHILREIIFLPHILLL